MASTEKATPKQTAIGCIILIVLGLVIWGGCKMCNRDDDKYEILSIDAFSGNISAYLKIATTDTNELKKIIKNVYDNGKNEILKSNYNPSSINVSLYTSKTSALQQNLKYTYLINYYRHSSGNDGYDINYNRLDVLNKRGRYKVCQKIQKTFETKSISYCDYLVEVNKIYKESHRLADDIVGIKNAENNMKYSDSISKISIQQLNSNHNISENEMDVSFILQMDCGCIDYNIY